MLGGCALGDETLTQVSRVVNRSFRSIDRVPGYQQRDMG
jgi:hypothetical protein